MPADWQTSCTPLPICPHCLWEIQDTADLVRQEGIERGDGEADCPGCGKTFAVTLEIVHAFTTRPLTDT